MTDGTVPGSIYTDLDNNGSIFKGGPLLYRFNDLDYRWVSYEDWDYTLNFDGIVALFCALDYVIDFLLMVQFSRAECSQLPSNRLGLLRRGYGGRYRPERISAGQYRQYVYSL